MPPRSGASSSSMNTATSFSSSWLEGSPSRQSPNRNSVHTPKGSLSKDAYESPSRQIQIEYNMMLSRSDRNFNERLDQAAAERAKIHNEQLSIAAQEHQRVQEGAKLEIQRLILEQEQERRRLEEAQRREIERLNREKAQQEAEAQRRQLEAKQREEAAAREAAERQKQIQEADARVRAQKQQEEDARRQKAEADRKAQESAAAAAAAAAAKAQIQPQAQIPTQASITSAMSIPATATQPTPTSTPAPGVEELHQKYLTLHARMKKFRKEFENECKKKDHPLKGPVGDARRSMRKRLGQVTVERKDSVAAIKALRTECFQVAKDTTGPMIDIRPYLVSQPIPSLANNADAQFPAFLLYVWICFEKSVIKQWTQEAANEDGTIIQELGLIAASLYADQKYMWNGQIPLTDTILAKLHRICPMLFGITGNMTTKQGLVRLGLDRFGGNNSDNEYGQQMTGVGAGFAALSLRQFSGNNPAIPMSEYWRAVVSISNTPSNDLYVGHFMVLKGLLRDFVRKFLTFYGLPAKAVLRRATRTLPERALKDRRGVHEAAGLVKVLPDSWLKNQRISID